MGEILLVALINAPASAGSICASSLACLTIAHRQFASKRLSLDAVFHGRGRPFPAIPKSAFPLKFYPTLISVDGHVGLGHV